MIATLQVMTRRLLDSYGNPYKSNEYPMYYAYESPFTGDEWTCVKDFIMEFKTLSDVYAWWNKYVTETLSDRSKRLHVKYFDLDHVLVVDKITHKVVAKLRRMDGVTYKL